jgi:hypothetical protein
MRLKPWASKEYPLDDDMRVVEMEVVVDNTPSTDLSFREYRGILPKTMYPNGTSKVRILPKDFSRNAGFKADCLFGSNLFPANCAQKITVCEGELDALSAYQMLSGDGYTKAVVALPSASVGGKFWANVTAYLDSFKEIILSTDNDDKGRRVAEVLFDLFPSKVKMVSLRMLMTSCKLVVGRHTRTLGGRLRSIAQQASQRALRTG